jgi:hypothetical protein
VCLNRNEYGGDERAVADQRTGHWGAMCSGVGWVDVMLGEFVPHRVRACVRCAQTAARDRLVADTQLKPIVDRLTKSILTISVSAVIGIAGLNGLALALGESGPMVPKVLVGEDAISFNNRLRSDEQFAAREQARARQKADRGLEVKPGYCDSRYYKILAGGNGQGGVGCN